MNLVATTLGPSAYWYLTRSTGAVALVLLTISVVLGILGSIRFSVAPRWPRFAIDTLHRDTSLLVIVLVVLHVITTVLDGFAPVTLLDGVIPFLSPYRPLWLGLGTLSFDLLIALVVTSLLRRRLGYRSWRAIHWLAYASWPVAVLHGLGTGTDVKSWWLLLLTVLCIAAVVVATIVRVGRSAGATSGIRTGATALSVATPVGIAIFALAGPLQKGWAAKAGTPASLLGVHHGSTAATAVRRPTPSAGVAKGPLDRPFSATFSGSASQSAADGGAIVDLSLRLGGGVNGQMRVRLGGAPLPGGGLSLTGSQVDLTAPGMPSAMVGRITSLVGSRFDARVTDASGSVVVLHANLAIDQASGAVTGTVSGAPSGGSR
ncbi:MAG TPA: ferric reductase-like transmembrane domain-containing protein [Solirubrobacteraceae bacterium]|nr:ferric reductase-like transmembrane domain-containing protein [Solirubrobacteraceae bacterium]